VDVPALTSEKTWIGDGAERQRPEMEQNAPPGREVGPQSFVASSCRLPPRPCSSLRRRRPTPNFHPNPIIRPWQVGVSARDTIESQTGFSAMDADAYVPNCRGS
jgi:hypothetical protein